MDEQRIIIEGHIIEGQLLDAQGPGHEVRVTVIAGGASKNGFAYNTASLQEIARLIEGAHAYADHSRTPADMSVRSVRDVVGFYKDAQFVPDGHGRVDATLHIFDAASWLWSIIQEAVSLGRPELIGVSIDILGQWQLSEATRHKHITNVLALNSCDVVTRPSAGGAIRRILHDMSEPEREGNSDIPNNSPTIPNKGDNPDMDPKDQANANANAANGEQGAASNEAQAANTATNTTNIQEAQATAQTQAQGANANTSSANVTAEAQRIMEQNQALLTQQNAELEALRAQRAELARITEAAKLERAQLTLETRLQQSNLPGAVKERVKSRFTGRVFEASELDAEMDAALQMMAELHRQGLVTGHGYERAANGSISGMVTEAEKVQAAFDRMFDLDIDTTKLGNVRGYTSILEAYARVTGTSNLGGGISDRSQIGSIRVNEAAPVDRITEADTTTASFSYLLGTSMNKRLLKDYQAWPAEWTKFTTIAPIRDFKQQSRVRFGAFGSLPIVAEDTAYTTATLSDSASTYVAQKRGQLVTVSRETIINDDLQAIKQIPSKLAVAAAYTLAEFVYGFLSTNPNIYDGNALFTSGAPHSNLGAAALSTAAMQTGITAMREQTNFAGKRIGLRPRFLVVPPELEWQSMVVTKSAGVPGAANNDINPMLGYVTPIISPQLTSSTQWFMLGDPREIDTIEVGFVGGQVNPALFIQDQPLFGLNFTQDSISYKIRHEYGAAVMDYRGMYRGI